MNNVTVQNNETTKNLISLVKEEMRVQNKQGRYLDFVNENPVTSENLNDYAKVLAAMVTPEGPQNEPSTIVDGKTVKGPRTRYGNALNTIKTGLKTALAKRDGEEEKAETETDWIRLVRQAAENASNKGGFSPEQILAAVSEAISSTETAAA